MGLFQRLLYIVSFIYQHNTETLLGLEQSATSQMVLSLNPALGPTTHTHMHALTQTHSEY